MSTPTRQLVPLEVRGLLKTYGEQVALETISFSLEAGEGLALLGPNGGGKTTLLSLCAGALLQDGGVALVCGEDVRRTRARRRIGFVPQAPALYEELSGEENVVLFGRLCGLAGARLRESAKDVLAAAELTASRRRRAGSYSGGMQRRLSVACALVHAPALLLLDEPFVGIDAASKRSLCEVLLARKRAGLAFVLSTHDPADVHALCERSLVLEAGRKVSESRLPDAGTRSRVLTLHPRAGERP